MGALMEKAIKRGGMNLKENFEPVRYRCVIISLLIGITDNKMKTNAHMQHIMI